MRRRLITYVLAPTISIYGPFKVEPPEGDGMRNWPPHTGGFSESFTSLNRNKRPVVFNLKKSDESHAT